MLHRVVMVFAVSLQPVHRAVVNRVPGVEPDQVGCPGAEPQVEPEALVQSEVGQLAVNIATHGGREVGEVEADVHDRAGRRHGSD